MSRADSAITRRVDETVPAWVATMREAAQAVLKPADIQAIVANQVAAAKKGDRQAIRFVFEQLLGGAYMRGATFVQHNYAAGAAPPADPAAPTPAIQGSDAKIEAMRRRVAVGLPATNPQDGPHDLT